MKSNSEFDPELDNLLNTLRDQPERDPQAATRTRQAFLSEAQALTVTFSAPVSAAPKGRLNGWMHGFQSIFATRRKEHSPMFSAIGTILLVLSLALGGGGITVAAAQSSLPDDPLYPVKTWSEDVRVQLTEDEQARLQLALMLFNRRAEELQAMFQGELTPPAALQVRMQAHVDEALQIAAGEPQQEAIQHLLQVREQVHLQQQAFQRLGPQLDPAAQAALNQTRTMLQDRLQLCDDGLADPIRLQQHLQDRLHDPDSAPEQQQNQNSDQDQQQNQQHNQAGDQDQQQIHDGDPDGVQIHDRDQDRINQPEDVNPPDPQTGGNSYGPGPDSEGEATGEPGSGSSYGPGPQPTDPPYNGDSGSQNGDGYQGGGDENEGGEGNHR